MSVDIEFPLSSVSGEVCPFTIWLAQDETSTPEYQRAIAAAESRMTGMPAFASDADGGAADTFLGQWL